MSYYGNYKVVTLMTALCFVKSLDLTLHTKHRYKVQQSSQNQLILPQLPSYLT